MHDAAPAPPHAAAIVDAQENQTADTSSQQQQQPSSSKSTAKTNPNPKTQPSKSAKRVKHKKKKVVDCDPVTAPAASGSTSEPAKNTAAPTDPTQNQNAAKPVSNCPPQKIVVRHGGATDPSIQLAGGTPHEDSQEQATANHMLQSTEENLKKLEQRQLSASEQETVTQIRQFMEQSKSALAASDTDRARTLAWKAQTLSDDLVKPR